MSIFDSDKAAQTHRHLHSHLPSDPALRVKALESLLVERGMVATETLDAWVEAYSEHIGPMRGAQVVARAWINPAFRDRLLANAAEAIKESVEESVAEVKEELDVALDDLEDLTVSGLRERLNELGLPTKGRKADLIARIVAHVEGSQ